MGYRVSIVGATGAVGQEFLRVLERRNFPVDRLRLFASPKSAGKVFRYKQENIPVEAYSPNAAKGEEIALLSAGSDWSKEFAKDLAQQDVLVIDNSSAFRLEKGVPLVVPEINPHAAKQHRGIIANPNCTTAILLMPLAPLHRIAKVKRVSMSSYQAASGKGAKGLEELEIGVKAAVQGQPLPASAFPVPLAMNVIPQVDSFLPDASTKEEWKVVQETRKILEDESIRMDVTCVRVPVRRCHSESVSAEFARPISVQEAQQAWSGFHGVQLWDEPSAGKYPHPLLVDGQDSVFVGRCRPSQIFDGGLSFWCVGDQLLKGAALNAVQIAELVFGVQPK